MKITRNLFTSERTILSLVALALLTVASILSCGKHRALPTAPRVEVDTTFVHDTIRDTIIIERDDDGVQRTHSPNVSFLPRVQ